MAKHFFKTLAIFLVMIIVGLIGVYLISYFDNSGESAKVPSAIPDIAK